MMRVLVTGVKGQLGFDIVRVLRENGIEHLGIDRGDLDITVEIDVYKFIEQYKPNIIIHCAAYTAVDKAEDDRDLCHEVNVLGTKYLVIAAKKNNAKFIYISTDYVFDGKGEIPFDVHDEPNPINYYGLTKYQGELEVMQNLDKYFIVRISWVFGINGNNFIKTMLRLSETKSEINVVCDQVGSPTYTFDLANAIYKLMQTNSYGIYHITNDGYCSWYEFALEIFKQANINILVNPILTKDYITKAVRPLNSKMIKNYLKLRSWKEALSHYLDGIKNNV